MANICKENVFEINRGDTHALKVVFKKDDGTAYDLTGCTLFFTAKKDLNETDNEAQIFKRITSIENPEQGIAYVSLTEDDTDVAGDYYFDIQLRFTTGKLMSSPRGRLIIYQDVTLSIS